MAEKLLKSNKRELAAATGRAVSTKPPQDRLRVCEGGACVPVWSPVKGMTPQQEKIESIVMRIATFCRNREMPVAKDGNRLGFADIRYGKLAA